MSLSRPVKSQNIYSALQLNQEREYKAKPPKKIVETITFFSASGRQTHKNVQIFDDAGMLLTEQRYDNDGNLEARLTYTNDTIHRLKLTRYMERWTRSGYLKETAFYTYDTNNFLIAVTDKDADGQLIQTTSLVCNEKGHPVELSLTDKNGSPYGKEKATYLYDRNKVVTSVISNDGRALSTDTIKISFITANKYPGENEIYNSNGDLTNWIRKNKNGTETIYEEEYTYDNFGNCTENKIYKITVKPNGKRKREIERIYRKEYSYL